jgi:hypothetical protein
MRKSIDIIQTNPLCKLQLSLFTRTKYELNSCRVCRKDLSGQRSMRSVYNGVVHLQVSVRPRQVRSCYKKEGILSVWVWFQLT